MKTQLILFCFRFKFQQFPTGDICLKDNCVGDKNGLWGFASVDLCWCTKEFPNSPEWSITKINIHGDKLTERVVMHSPLHAL